MLNHAIIVGLLLSFALILSNCEVDSTNSSAQDTGGTTLSCNQLISSQGMVSSGISTYSHNTGTNCLGCHGAGGMSSVTWTVAGSMYTGLNSTLKASAGTVVTVGGVSLTVDNCGNFYTSNPVTYVGDNPSTSLGTMLTTTLGVSDNNCNSGLCHGMTHHRIY